jgi:single-strand selective monofunctional uracil DNA glycosylase
VSRNAPGKLLDAARALRDGLDHLSFAAPVACVYNPLQYAWPCHEDFVRRYARPGCGVLLLGMNPGPWGMAQTGVPFGEVTLVRDWLGIRGEIGQPPRSHPKRPIEGWGCTRSEVSGARLWGWARERYGTPEAFFERFYVHNYCPLCFMEASGRNLTPDKLPAAERAPLEAACDEALRKLVAALHPQFLVGVGGFAEERLRHAIPDFEGTIGRILHPSPASPAANRGWAAQAEKQLAALGVPL